MSSDEPYTSALASRLKRRGVIAPPDRQDRIYATDSHTGGEPTRVVAWDGSPLAGATMRDRLESFRREHDNLRRAIVNEPRGSDVLVGAMVVDAIDPLSLTGVIFFNNVGYLGMCGHGSIGLISTLAYHRAIEPGVHTIETAVGKVSAELHHSGAVTIENVPSYRHLRQVKVAVEGFGDLVGDVAWGGNWFFLAEDHGQDLLLSRVEELTDFTWRVREGLRRAGITGRNGAEIDHIELSAPSSAAGADSRNFVLCPGKAYDRSPCGTGTSARLACLYEDGRLREGEVWRQESITGSVFEGRIRELEGRLIPSITGRAYITACLTLMLDPADPYCWGIA